MLLLPFVKQFLAEAGKRRGLVCQKAFSFKGLLSYANAPKNEAFRALLSLS